MIIVNVPLRKKLFGKAYFSHVDIPMEFKIGTLENLAEYFRVDLWNINEVLKNQTFDYNSELLYQAYLLACMRLYKRPEYTRDHASVWPEVS